MTDPPRSLGVVAAKVDDRLESLLVRERVRWHRVDARLTEAVDELGRIAAGGKRLRAAFCYWAWRGLAGRGVDDRPAIDAATAFELLQAFALIHDDVMDDAATRRGETTVHVAQGARVVDAGWRAEPRRYGEGVAILVGDLGHVYADRLMGELPPSARSVWDELRIELNLGQYLDLRTAAAFDLDRDTAERVAIFKTALYTVVRPMQLGALLADPDLEPEVLRKIDEFGRPVGQAFQLRDDLLGVVGDPRHVGKPVGSDLREGKPTELVALAAERATEPQRRILDQIGQRDLEPAAIAEITRVLVETDAVLSIEQRIDELVKHAAEVAADLPFEAAAGTNLVALAEFVAARTH